VTAFLVEFSSVVDVLRCAVEAQANMTQRNAEISSDRRIEFRMGINVGDIVVEDGDIFGDGVNVAARLEGLAEPGGICVSSRVQEDAAGKLDLSFVDIGEQELKNIARPVRAYRVKRQTAQGRVREATQPSLALPDKPSIAVLPFANMSDDPEQEYFADGMVEEIITALSRIRSLFVIARNSSFTYKGRAVDVKEVGRELGVHYVLEFFRRFRPRSVIKAAAGNPEQRALPAYGQPRFRRDHRPPRSTREMVGCPAKNRTRPASARSCGADRRSPYAHPRPPAPCCRARTARPHASPAPASSC
jgi:Adenylate and Guanylate cyclase catalytic domain